MARRRKEQRWSSWDIERDSPNPLRTKSTWPDTEASSVRIDGVGKTMVGEKNNSFLAETLSNLRFFGTHSPSTLSTPKNI
jgi:hypothetical protein